MKFDLNPRFLGGFILLTLSVCLACRAGNEVLPLTKPDAQPDFWLIVKNCSLLQQPEKSSFKVGKITRGRTVAGRMEKDYLEIWTSGKTAYLKKDCAEKSEEL